MRRRVIGAIAAMALTSTGAGAADLYRNPSPYAPGPVPYGYSWMGPYLGANFGYQWGELSNSGANPSGVAGGFQGGYNWQFGQFVVGGETDIQLSDSNDVFANYKFSNPWLPMGAAMWMSAAWARTTCTPAGPRAEAWRSA
jgi:outer membrane immunogenic protein